MWIELLITGVQLLWENYLPTKVPSKVQYYIRMYLKGCCTL